MSTEAYTPPRRLPRLAGGKYPPWLGIVLAGCWMIGSFFWMIAVGVLTLLLLVVASSDLSALTKGTVEFPAWILAVSTWVQFAGMVGLAALLAYAADRAFKLAFATRTPPLLPVFAAALGGF